MFCLVSVINTIIISYAMFLVTACWQEVNSWNILDKCLSN